MNLLNCLKFSLIQFLLNKEFTFLIKKNEIVFEILSNDKKVYIQNNVEFPNSSSIIICSYFPIEYQFINKEKILDIVNFLNEFSSVFNAYLKFDEECKMYLLFIKSQITLISEQLIDENFWNCEIKTQINNISNIVNFIYYELPKSPYFKQSSFNKEFKMFMGECIGDYTKTIQIIEEENLKKEIDYNQWSKKEINKEIDKELEKWSKGEKNEWKLNLLVSALKNKDK